MDRRGIFLGLAFSSLAVASAACSSSGGTGISTPRPSPSPTGVVIGTLGNINCTAPNNALPGTYAAFESYGSVTGTTYTQYPYGYIENPEEGNGYQGDFFTAAYTAPTGATPAPTDPPPSDDFPSPVPSSAPGAVLAIVYYGEYTLPQTTGLTTAASNGCFYLETTQGFFEEENTSVHRSSRAASSGGLGSAHAASGLVASAGRTVLDATPAPSPTPFDSYGYGLPAFAYPYANESDDLTDGDVTAFTITNLTRTTGTGMFTLGYGEGGTASGTATITGSTAFYYVPDESEGALAFKRRPFHLRRR